MSTEQRDPTALFTTAKRKRGGRYRAKDKVILPLLESVEVRHPATFKAVLMPCLYGPELAILEKKGVRREHILAVERDPEVHAIQRDPKQPAHAHLRGILTPPRPMGAEEAVDFASLFLGQADLIYLDFFGQPALPHWTTLFKIFRLRLLASGGLLILTFGASRGHPFACKINSRLRSSSPARAYVDSALKEAEHPPYAATQDHPYVSLNLPYITTEFRF